MIRYINFGELQSIYVFPFRTTQSNTLLIDMLITLSLKAKLGLRLQIFDLHLQTGLREPLPHSLLRLEVL